MIVDEAWVELKTEDGRTYFWNRRENSRAWVVPEGTTVKWVGQKSPDGRTYYWSRENKETVWVLPPLPSTPDGVVEATEPPNDEPPDEEPAAPEAAMAAADEADAAVAAAAGGPSAAAALAAAANGAAEEAMKPSEGDATEQPMDVEEEEPPNCIFPEIEPPGPKGESASAVAARHVIEKASCDSWFHELGNGDWEEVLRFWPPPENVFLGKAPKAKSDPYSIRDMVWRCRRHEEIVRAFLMGQYGTSTSFSAKDFPCPNIGDWCFWTFEGKQLLIDPTAGEPEEGEEGGHRIRRCPPDGSRWRLLKTGLRDQFSMIYRSAQLRVLEKALKKKDTGQVQQLLAQLLSRPPEALDKAAQELITPTPKQPPVRASEALAPAMSKAAALAAMVSEEATLAFPSMRQPLPEGPVRPVGPGPGGFEMPFMPNSAIPHKPGLVEAWAKSSVTPEQFAKSAAAAHAASKAASVEGEMAMSQEATGPLPVGEVFPKGLPRAPGLMGGQERQPWSLPGMLPTKAPPLLKAAFPGAVPEALPAKAPPFPAGLDGTQPALAPPPKGPPPTPGVAAVPSTEDAGDAPWKKRRRGRLSGMEPAGASAAAEPEAAVETVRAPSDRAAAERVAASAEKAAAITGGGSDLLKRRVVVSNIPPHGRLTELADFFTGAIFSATGHTLAAQWQSGEASKVVLGVELAGAAAPAASRTAEVTFGTGLGASVCVALNGIQFQGKSLSIKRPKAYAGPQQRPKLTGISLKDLIASDADKHRVKGDGSVRSSSGASVQLSGIPSSMGSKSVYDLLVQFGGPLQSLNLSMNRETGEHMGTGVAEYVEAASALEAVRFSPLLGFIEVAHAEASGDGQPASKRQRRSRFDDEEDLGPFEAALQQREEQKNSFGPAAEDALDLGPFEAVLPPRRRPERPAVEDLGPFEDVLPPRRPGSSPVPALVEDLGPFEAVLPPPKPAA